MCTFEVYLQLAPAMTGGQYESRFLRVRSEGRPLLVRARDGGEAIRQVKARGFLKHPVVKEAV